jgi:hypothetical protein
MRLRGVCTALLMLRLEGRIRDAWSFLGRRLCQPWQDQGEQVNSARLITACEIGPTYLVSMKSTPALKQLPTSRVVTSIYFQHRYSPMCISYTVTFLRSTNRYS